MLDINSAVLDVKILLRLSEQNVIPRRIKKKMRLRVTEKIVSQSVSAFFSLYISLNYKNFIKHITHLFILLKYFTIIIAMMIIDSAARNTLKVCLFHTVIGILSRVEEGKKLPRILKGGKSLSSF